MKSPFSHQRLRLMGIWGFFLFLGVSRVAAAELMSTADVLEAKSWGITVYGTHVEEEPEVSIDGVNAIQIPTSGGSSTIFSNSNADIELETEYEAAVLAATFRPHDGFHYQVRLGQVRDFKMEFSSGNLVNALRAADEGFLWGVGVRWNITPGTIVSTAFALDLSYTQISARLDRFDSNGVVSPANQKYFQDEIQAALNVSRRWKIFEPYAGLKLLRTTAQLRDSGTKEEVEGTKEGVSPFVGLQLEVFPKEVLLVEISFVDQEAISAGLKLKF